MHRGAKQAGLNEAIFHRINDEIGRLAERWQLPVGFLCECEDLGCAERLDVPLGVYAELRERPDHFIVAPGHDHAEHEVVVEHHPDYLIVRKTGDAAVGAERFDRRG